MTSIDNSGFQVCGNCDCPGFVPTVNWSFNATTKALTITDASTFPSGDGLAAINVVASDGAGHTKSGRIAVAAGNVVLDLSSGMTLGPNGINISATVVTTHRCAGDLASFNIGIATDGSGTLGSKDVDGDVDGSLS